MRSVVIHPAVPLDWGRRYVIGLRRLEKKSGGLVASSAAFSALRDGVDSEQPDVIRRRAHFEGRCVPGVGDGGVHPF